MSTTTYLIVFYTTISLTVIASQGTRPDYKTCVDSCFLGALPNPQLQVKQGVPGKRGPPGPHGGQGPIGPQGVPGRCECDLSEIQKKVANLEEIVRRPLTLEQAVTECSLGVKYGGDIPNSAFTQNARYNANGKGDAHQGRLNTKRSSALSYGAWHSKSASTSQWIQVDLGASQNISRIVMQGKNNFEQWVKTYKVLFGDDVNNLQHVIATDGCAERVFVGNCASGDTLAQQFIKPPITARYVRINPINWQGHPTLRFELTSC